MEPDLSRSIDALYNERVITKTTCEHYHKIRMLGNSAVHENNTSAYDANQAYQFLSQEVYTFSHDYRQANAARQPHPRAVPSQTERRTSGSSKGSSSSRSRKKSSDSRFSSTDLIRLGAVLVCVWQSPFWLFVWSFPRRKAQQKLLRSQPRTCFQRLWLPRKLWQRPLRPLLQDL